MERRLIPGTIGFYADTTGNIFNNNNIPCTTYLNTDGYKTVAILRSDYKWQTFGVHRLIAKTFLPLPDDGIDYKVNHIDYNKLNNNLHNLEWVTDKENNIHAALMRGSCCRPLIIIKSPEGNFNYIDSIHDVARILNCDLRSIWLAIKNGTEINKHFLYYNSKTTPIPENLKKVNYSGIGKNSQNSQRKLDFYNLETNEVKTIDSIYAACKLFNVNPSAVFNTITSKNKVRLFQRKYIIVNHGEALPYLSKERLKTLRDSTGRDVLAYNVKHKKYFMFNSASKFIKEFLLSKKAVTTLLRNNKIKEVSGWLFIYVSDANIEKLKGYINCPG